MSYKVAGGRVCGGCLSEDRCLRPLREHYQLFLLLRGDQTTSLKLQYGDILLCWECVALLRRVSGFQERIRKAQAILQQELNQKHIQITPSLSTLSVNTVRLTEDIKTEQNQACKIPNLHTTIEFIDGLSAEVFKEEIDDTPKEEITDTELAKEELNDIELAKEEVTDIDLDQDVLDTDPAEFDEKFVLEDYNKKNVLVLERTNNIELTIEGHHATRKSPIKEGKDDETKKKNTTRLRYDGIAKVTKNDNIDYHNLKKHYKKVVLSHEELDELIARDNGIANYTDLPYRCTPCKSGFRYSVDLARHKMFAKKHFKPHGPYKCLECRATLPSQQLLSEHWRARHDFVYKCGVCGAVVRRQVIIRLHVSRIHRFVYTCRDCGYQAYSSSEFSHHYKSMHKQFICDDCGVTYKSKRGIQWHIRSKHDHACSKCRRQFKDKAALYNHKRRCFIEVVLDTPRRELAYCVECNKQFHTVERYKVHLTKTLKHNRKKPRKKESVSCPQCDKVFCRITSMKNHFNLVHGTSKHYCQPCNKYYVNGYALRTHNRSVHEGVRDPKNKICDICSRGFRTNEILKRHRRTHTGERPYACAYCSAAFAQSTARVSHQRTHHKQVASQEWKIGVA